MHQVGGSDARSVQRERLQLTAGTQMPDSRVANIEVGQIEYFQLADDRQLDEAVIGHLSSGQVKCPRVAQRLQVLQPGVADRGVAAALGGRRAGARQERGPAAGADALNRRRSVGAQPRG